MTLKDDLGMLPRVLYGIFGLVLALATIGNDYHDWSLVEAGRQSLVVFVLVNLLALPLSILIVLWACIGRHREWRIAGNRIQVRLLSLTSWQKMQTIQAAEISGFELQSFEHEDAHHRTAYWMTLTLSDGRRIESPKTFNKSEAEKACLQIEILKSSIQSSDDLGTLSNLKA